MPEQEDLRERLLAAWLGLSASLKNTRMTKGITYNEAAVMKLVYDRYRLDGVGLTAVRSIRQQTGMLKSLANRTIDSLCAQGYLTKEQGGTDARLLYVRPVPERLSGFLAVHEQSLRTAQDVIDVIGERDAACFVRICEKFLAAGVRF